MSCRKYQDALVALARGEGDARDHGDTRAHLEGCASCRHRFVEQQAVTAGLRALAEANRHEQPPDVVEARLLARFDEERKHGVAPVAARTRVWLRWVPAAAAVVLVAGAVAWWQAARTPRAPARPASVGGVIELAGFLPIPQAAALPDFDGGVVVRTEIAVAALPVYGVGTPLDAAAAAVEVDLLVGQDGQPRAIRLVTDESQDSRSQR